jgi:competence protein ComEA
MNKVKVRVLIDWLRHDGERRQPGDEIEVDSAVADLLVEQRAVERVSPAQGQKVAQAAKPDRGEVESEAEVAADGKIRVNYATAETLRTVRGIGPQLADAIVARRRQQGAFARLEDLVGLAGIGPKSIKALADQLTCT